MVHWCGACCVVVSGTQAKPKKWMSSMQSPTAGRTDTRHTSHVFVRVFCMAAGAARTPSRPTSTTWVMTCHGGCCSLHTAGSSGRAGCAGSSYMCVDTVCTQWHQAFLQMVSLGLQPLLAMGTFLWLHPVSSTARASGAAMQLVCVCASCACSGVSPFEAFFENPSACCASQAANCFGAGYDKLPLDEREKFARSKLPAIKAAGALFGWLARMCALQLAVLVPIAVHVILPDASLA